MKSVNKPKTTTILFTRHAVAMDHDIAQKRKVSDPDRPLTKPGIKEFKQNIKRRKKLLKKTDLFLSSPYLRARQTLALILKLKSARKHKAKIFKFIRHDDSPSHFLNWIQKTSHKKIVAVSHEPYMSHFMKALFKTKWKPVKIKKGQIIRITLSPDKKSYKIMGYKKTAQ